MMGVGQRMRNCFSALRTTVMSNGTIKTGSAQVCSECLLAIISTLALSPGHTCPHSKVPAQEPHTLREAGGRTYLKDARNLVGRKFNCCPTDLAFVTLTPSCLPQPKQLSFAYDLWTERRKLRKMREGVGSFG